MMVSGALYWDRMPEIGTYSFVESWPYKNGNVGDISFPPGMTGRLLVNDEPWNGDPLKCGDSLQLEIVSVKDVHVPAHVEEDFSTDHERCPDVR